MKIIKTKSYDELSSLAADILFEQVKRNPCSVLGLATGSTPIGSYDKLVQYYEAGMVSFNSVKTINLDEYCGLCESHEQSYRFFMNTHLFNRIDIKKENTFVPNGLAKDIYAECRHYDEIYESIGPCDIQLLGIGVNGHIGFNEPDSSLVASTHCVTLSESTRAANSRNFASLDDVPSKAITLGLAGIMKAKRVLLLASGKAKLEAIKKTVYGDIDPHVPASFLQLHSDVTVICDFDIGE